MAPRAAFFARFAARFSFMLFSGTFLVCFLLSMPLLIVFHPCWVKLEYCALSRQTASGGEAHPLQDGLRSRPRITTLIFHELNFFPGFLRVFHFEQADLARFLHNFPLVKQWVNRWTKARGEAVS